MDLIQVHIIHLQAFEGVVDGSHDVLARESAVVDVIAQLSMNFGSNHYILTIYAKMTYQAARDTFTFSN